MSNVVPTLGATNGVSWLLHWIVEGERWYAAARVAIVWPGCTTIVFAGCTAIAVTAVAFSTTALI